MQTTAVRHMRRAVAILVAFAAVSVSAQTPLIEQAKEISRGDTAAAIDILEKAASYSPKSAEAHFYLANAHYFLGAIYENEGKKAEAKQSYQPTLKLNPSLKQASEALKRVS